MNTEIVFAVYRPNLGKDAEFEGLLKQHGPLLRELELITEREVVLVRAKNGSFVEVFEWRSKEAAKRAHDHPDVAQIWERMASCASFATLDSLEESKSTFPHFLPLA